MWLNIPTHVRLPFMLHIKIPPRKIAQLKREVQMAQHLQSEVIQAVLRVCISQLLASIIFISRGGGAVADPTGRADVAAPSPWRMTTEQTVGRLPGSSCCNELPRWSLVMWWFGAIGGFSVWGQGIIGQRQLTEDCQSTGVGIVLYPRAVREQISIVLCCMVHMEQVFPIHFFIAMSGGDGVSFVESLPRPLSWEKPA